MGTCAYCDRECVPTKEHVTPAWYGDVLSPDRWEVFNARKPLTHLRGPLLVRDVCSACNNGPLSRLDDYGKTLYEAFLREPLCFGESRPLDLDVQRLTRWLVKLNYNCARVNNADVTILCKYRRFALGSDTTPEPVVYVNAISPTDVSTEPFSPARRDALGEHAFPIRWFRFVQYRAVDAPFTNIVQRQVYIDGFCFTLFATDPDSAHHAAELPALLSRFEQTFPGATRLKEDGRVTLTAGELHAEATASWHFANYPSRYGFGPESQDPKFVGAMNSLSQGTCRALLLPLRRAQVESADYSYLTQRLNELVATQESAKSALKRVVIYLDGYQQDERNLWDIPEVRRALQTVFRECPFLFLLLHPETESLDVFILCCCEFARQDDGSIVVDREALYNFLTLGLEGMNRVCHRLALSTETNVEITDLVFARLTGQHRPAFTDV